MIYSKRVRGSYFKPTKKSANPIVQKIVRIKDDILDKTYYKIMSEVRCFIERLGRSLAFARMAWLNFDFDFSYLYKVMYFKMERILKVLENGHLEQDKEVIDSLKEAIKICKRLCENNHDSKYFKLHDKKWGRLGLKLISGKNSLGEPAGTGSMFSPRRKLKNATKEVKHRERKEFLACMENGEMDRKADIDRLAVLLKEHSLTWWD